MNKAIAAFTPAIICLLTAFVVPVYGADAKEDEDVLMTFFGTVEEPAFKEPEPLLMNVYGRERQSLNGPWEIYIDEPGLGYRAISKGAYLSAQKPNKNGMELLEISFDERLQLQVPGDWNSQKPELDRYRGKVIYHKVFDAEKQQDNRYFLHFGAANYKTEVFLNDSLIGRHEGGYTSFNFDVTDHLLSGENVVIVRVDAFLDDTDIPTMRTSDFWKYGGITRDVNLVTVPTSYIGQYHAYLSDREASEITAWIQLAGDKIVNRKVRLSIPDVGIQVTAKTDTHGRVTFTQKAKGLLLWSPALPQLYDVTIALDNYEVKDRIGFRTIETVGTDIVLNGEPVRLMGVSMHEETILRPGVANSIEDAEASLGLIKELGANFVRLAHYPHNEHTLKLADELGLMVWSEIPIVSAIDWTNKHSLQIAQTQIAENVSRDLNRAAIVMWSIANETFPQTDERLAFLKSLADIARNLDNSKRPIASALIGNFAEEFGAIQSTLIKLLIDHPKIDNSTREKLQARIAKMPEDTHDGLLTVMIDDPLGEVVDIVGYNQYFGWYYAMFFAQIFGLDEGLIRETMFTIMPDIRFSNVFDKPMIISEFGAGAKAGFHSKDAVLWSEEYQAKVYQHQLAMLEKSPLVKGMSPWVLKDFRSHMRQLNGIQDTYNRKGLVSETGEKKLAFEVLKEYYEGSLDQIPAKNSK
jgi:beta-glucuronidase